MIERPDDKVVESMARIRHDPDFKRIVEWLRTEKVSLAERAMVMDGIERMQGAYLTVKELVDTIDDAAAVIEATHERKKARKTHIP
jgi:hypothetical protein